MKPKSMSLRVISALTGAAILSFFPQASAQATSGTWNTDAAGNWTDPLNWLGDTTYAEGADFTATFGNFITADRIITLDTGITIGNITAADTTHNYTISGANILTLDRTDAIAPTIDVITSRTLTISSQVAGNDGLIKSGAGILVLSGNNIISGNAVVNGGTLQLSGINSFGDITVNGATLSSAGTAVGPGTLGAAGGTITFTGTSFYNPQRDLPAAYNKNVNISSGTTTFQQSTQFYHENFSGVFSGAGTLVKNDSNGILTFSNAANTFTGAIRLDTGAGGLVVNSLADSANAITFNGNTGALSLGAGIASSLLFNSRQIVLAHANGGEITNNNASASNTITINTNLGFSGTGTRLLELGGTNTGLNTFDGNITNNTNGGAATSVTKSGSGRWLISGDMSHTGGISFGGGTLVLSGTNTYSGATNFTAANIQLIFAGTQAVSPNTTYVMNTNASTSNSSVKLLDDTGGVNNTLVTATGSTFRIQNSNSPGNNHDFIVGNNNTANGGTSSGTTTGSTIAIGTLHWNTYAANTTAYGPINIQGTNGYRLQINNVVLHNAANLASNVVGNTFFTPTTANVTLGTVTVGTGNVNQGIQTFVMDGTSSDNRVTGAISNASDFGTSNRELRVTKSNSSTWTLGGTNTYTGTTTVSGGRLRITGDSSAATGNVTVSGGALGGNAGSLGGAVTVSSTGGINLADGSVGSLTLGSTLGVTGAAGANNLSFDLGNTTGTSDQLSVAGATTVTNAGAAVINLNQLGGTAGRTATTYTLIGGAGTLAGADFAKFSLATTAAFGQTYALTNTGDNLQVVATNVTSATPAAFWAGGGNNWSTTTNWRASLAGNDAVAGAPDYQTNVTFSTTTPVAANLTTNVLDADFNINSLTLTNASGNVTIGGTKMLTIEAAAVNGNTAGNGIDSQKTSGTNTISAKVGLASSQTWTVATSGTLAVSGAISDFGAGFALTKAGGGNLSLSGATTYTGGNTITGGTLTVAAASVGAFNAGPLTLSGGGRLTLTGVNVTSSSQVSVGTGGGLISVAGNNNYTTTGKLTGSGTLTQAEPGGGGAKTFNFNSLENDFTGGINLNYSTNGTFVFSVNSLADSANNIAFNSTGGNSATFAFGSGAIAPLTFGASGRAIELNSAAALTGTVQNNNTTQAISIGTNLIATGAGAKTLGLSAAAGPTNVFSGSITNGTGGGTIGVTKTSAGDWSLSNANNTYSGDITLSSTTTSAGTLSYASAGGANAIKFLQTTGTATLSYTGSGQTMSGPITASALTTGTITLNASGAGAVNYSNTGSLGSAGSGIKNLILSGTNAGDNILAGQWVNNTGAAATLTKNDTGKWVLSGTNNYTGITRVNAGTLQFANQASLYNGNSANWTAANINVKHGATFAVNVDSAGTNGFTGLNLNTLLGNISVANTTAQGLQGGATIGIDTSTADLGTFTQGNAIANSTGAAGGTIGLTKLGTGTLVLDKANTYTGATTIQAGTLSLGSNNRLSNSTPVTVAGGTLDISTFTNTVASFSMSSGALNGTGTLTAATYMLTGGTLAANLGAGAVTVNGNVTFSAAGRLNASSSLLIQGGTLTLSGDENVNSFQQTGGIVAGGFSINSATDSELESGTFSGKLGGNKGLNKKGVGKIIITGNNTYTGATNVTSGVLAVNGSLGYTTTTVDNGATLQGSGSIAGSVTVNTGATLATGNSIESLGTGALALNAGSTFAYELQTDLYAGIPNVAGDLTYVTGNLDITTGALLTLTDLAAISTVLANNSSLTLISYTGAWNGGLFTYDSATLNDDSTFVLGANTWRFNYNDSAGGPNYASDQIGATNFVTMTVIPEPRAALLGCLGVLLILRRRR
jgi:fibronectin-binding autotransporter adhesin